MKYLLLKNYDHYAIVNDDADFIVGRVDPLNGRGGFRVSADLAPDWCNGDVDIVQSLDDAIPALAAYYERNPPQWQRETATRDAKFTQFAFLRVAQDESGHWLAKRDDCPMLRGGKPALFPSREEA